MSAKKFLLLQSNHMAVYMLNDIDHLDNVVIYHRKHVFNNRFLNLLYNIHHSGKIQKYVNLPFKSVWNRILFGKLLKSFTPDYIVFTTSWYSESLLRYFRKKCQTSKIIFRFSDMIANGLGNDFETKLDVLRNQFDGVLVYSQEDAGKYGFTYHSVGYSPIRKDLLKPCKQYDVVFIGAEKGRMEKIRQAYHQFVSAGLSCFFYVILVKEEDRRDDGIIYGDEVMPFVDYLSYEVSARCLFEIVQEGSTGRTFRMMEAIMYNKLLITNCAEMLNTNYYNPEYVQMFHDVSEIDPSFVANAPDTVDYHYQGDFSPVRVLDFIEKNW